MSPSATTSSAANGTATAASKANIGVFTNPKHDLWVSDAEPSLETVLDVMYRSGFRGDVYPAPWMWEAAPRVFPRYPFPDSFRQMCDGGF